MTRMGTSAAEKHAVGGVGGLLHEGIAEPVEKLPEGRLVGRRNLHSDTGQMPMGKSARQPKGRATSDGTTCVLNLMTARATSEQY